MKSIERFFLSRYDGSDFVMQRKAKTFFYFTLIIPSFLLVTTTGMILISAYGLFSFEAASRIVLILLGVIGLVLLRVKRYYTAANVVVIGATLVIGSQIFLVGHETAYDLVLGIILPYLFIISAALLSNLTSVLITSVLTAGIGAVAVLLSDIVPDDAVPKIIGVHVAITLFIAVQCFIIMRNITLALEEVGERMKKSDEQSSIIKRLLGNAQDLSLKLASSSDTLSSTAMHLSENAQNQASSVEEITASMEEISAGVENIAQSADTHDSIMVSLLDKMKEFNRAVTDSKNEIETMLARVEKIRESASLGTENLETMSGSMTRIKDSSGEMTGIINIINDISDQINLLSLNAAIEAARAGEFGRGFAVVADQISKLAEETSQSVKNIGDIIISNDKEIDDGRRVVEFTVDTIKKIIEGVNANYQSMQMLAMQMEKQIESNNAINEDVNNAKNRTSEIKTATSEHKVATQEIVKTVSTINEMTQSNSAGAEETFSNTEELSSMAAQLKELITSIDN